MPILLALALAWGTAGFVHGIVIDFEGVPEAFNYDGSGLDLGDHYVGQPGGPIFGPQATVVEAGGGTLNVELYPPRSGIGVLWGDHNPIEVSFSTGLASMVGFYYRSNTELHLFAFDADGALLGSSTGSGSLAPEDDAGFLSYQAGAYVIAHVLIRDSRNFFVIDDFSYAVQGAAVPDKGASLLLTALCLGAVVLGFHPGRLRAMG